MMHHSISRAFNRAANTYDQYAILQHTVGKKLISLLPSNRHFQHTIDLGCGTGITTEQLILHHSQEQMHAIDIAPEFLAIAKKRLAAYPIHLHLENFDIKSWPKDSFDLIFSNMALQWSCHLENMLLAHLSYLKNNGYMAFSLPLNGTFDELHHAFSILTLPDNQQLLDFFNRIDCELVLAQQETHIQTFTNTLEALRSIRLVGATHTSEKRLAPTLAKSLVRAHHITQLTYIIGYYILRKR
jgi:malonyl-CoA O-methyltransferase